MWAIGHRGIPNSHPNSQRLLIDAGHEDEGISLNTDFETPLMLACEAKQVDAGKLLIAAFPRCVPWSNKQGMDAVSFSTLTLSSATLSPLTPPYS
jgi:hypothetical protein